jgi:hypothetical protein
MHSTQIEMKFGDKAYGDFYIEDKNEVSGCFIQYCSNEKKKSKWYTVYEGKTLRWGRGILPTF